MSTQKSVNKDMILNNDERDTLGEIGNICMGTCATTLSTLLGKRVTITTPQVSLLPSAELFNEFEKPIVMAEVSYVEGIEGNNIFLLKKEDALLITDLLMGNDGTSPGEELNEYYMSATSEVMNQMVGSAATALAEILQVHINISPPVVNEVSRDNDLSAMNIKDEMFVRVSFRMEIEGLLVSNIMNLMPYDFGKNLAGLLIGDGKKDNAKKQEPQEINSSNASKETQKNEAAQPDDEAKKKIGLKAVKYQSFGNAEETIRTAVSPETAKSIDLIMDVPLQVTVVLGKSKRSIKEILEMGTGSVVVLDRLAGEMVDVLVNGKLFARGEVVVIDDNYGVRITELTAAESTDSAISSKQVLLDMVGSV